MNLPTQYELSMIAATLSGHDENSYKVANRALALWKACGRVVHLEESLEKANRQLEDKNLADIKPLLQQGTAPYRLGDILKAAMPRKKEDEALAVYRDYVRWNVRALDPNDKKQVSESEKLAEETMSDDRRRFFSDGEAQLVFVFLSRYVEARSRYLLSERGQKGSAVKIANAADKNRSPKEKPFDTLKTPQAKAMPPQAGKKPQQAKRKQT
jgi:hypothetical protein